MDLELTGTFEVDRDSVVAAMLFPSDERLRLAYLLRKDMERSSGAGAERTLTPHQQRVILDWPSRVELRHAADAGSKCGIATGDLIAIMYDGCRRGKGASMRAALAAYGGWALGKSYGTGKPLKYSERQLRTYFNAAKAAGHLWGAWRLIASMNDDGKRSSAIFESAKGFGFFLGVAADVQRFVTTHIPERTHGREPTVPASKLILLPSFIKPIAVDPLR